MKTSLAVSLSCIAFFLTSCGTTSSIPAADAIDGILAAYSSPDAPGAGVLVMKNDSVVFKKGYGLADLENGVPVTTVTNFRLASITKQFTAMSVLILAERGLLSIDDPITGFFPDFPPYGREITVRHLLNHTSGLVDYESLIPDSQTVQVFDKDCLTLISSVDSLYFPAGSRYQYSNTGYALLALIVEKVSGIRFADFLRTQIFDKVGMPATVAFENGISSVLNRAYGYSFIDSTWKRTDQSNTSAVLGDGGIYSNVEEMAWWISAVWNNKLISHVTQQSAWSNAVLNDGTKADYGMGWHLETYRGQQHPHHGGSTIGFRNHILIFPGQKLMVVILTNRNQGNPITEAKKIADIFLDK